MRAGVPLDTELVTLATLREPRVLAVHDVRHRPFGFGLRVVEQNPHSFFDLRVPHTPFTLHISSMESYSSWPPSLTSSRAITAASFVHNITRS